MMPSFTAPDVGMLGREWWHRCHPQIFQALAISTLFGLLVGGGLTVKQVSLDTLTLWSKYQIGRGAAGLGLSSLRLSWPGERGETRTTVGELLQTPGLDAWAEAVSWKIGGAGVTALLSGLLAFIATLFWSTTRVAPDRPSTDAPEPVVTIPDPSPPLEVEEPLPAILPQPPTLPVELPHLSKQSESPPPNNPPPAARPSTTPPDLSPAPNGKPCVSYEFYWGFSELPFENVPDPKFYFPTAIHEEALHRLLYGVQTRKGALMLTGEIGCGKTLLSRELSLHLAGQQYDVAVIANPSFGVEDFLTEVLYQFGIEPTKTKVKLLHLLNERLMDNFKRGKQTVVVIDEAQTIQDDQVFEELRLLLNFQLNDRFLLTLVLLGQPELNERVMKLKQFAQRISIKYHLSYFSGQQTSEYILFRLKAAKCTKEIFSEEALGMIFKQSGGVPRNINTICDLCLLIGYMDRAASVDRKIVERAAAERGQLGLF
ncbi:MAG TPA: AAA family ATPase [Nitrospiraceae bacterium]|nr:AAA family ATPase [Nitrospiraceae bacterium]